MARRKLLLWLTPLLLLRQDGNFAVQRRLMSELHVGEKVPGVVSHVTSNLVLVDVGVEKEGVLPNSKIAPGSSSAEVAIGEEVEVWVSQVKNEENLRRSQVLLSSDSEKVFSPSEPDALQELQQLDAETWLRGFVVAQRPFGLLVAVAPPNQPGVARGARAVGVVYQKGAQEEVGSEVKVRILNLDLEKQKLTLTMQAEAPRPRNVAAAMEPFKNSGELRGRVLSRGKFGVFVALRPPDGPLDGSETVGLLHKKASIPRPESVDQLKLGQELEGVVVRTTPEMTLIDLGFKSRGLLPPAKMMAKSEVHVGDRLQVWVSELRNTSLILASDPKKVLSVKSLGPAASLKDYEINTWYPGVVLRLSPFGAFVAIRSTSGKWAEGLVKTNQIQGNLELGAEFRIRVLDVDLARRRIDLSMRSSESSTISARFATLQKLKNEIFPARVISVEETGAEVELRHPQTSVLGWLSNELQKGSKPLKPGEEIEVLIVDIDMEKYTVSLSETQVPKGIRDQDFASLLADELGEDAIDMLREGDEVQVVANISQRGLDLSLV